MNNRITIDPARRSGKPCIRGFRITVNDILGYLASGMTNEEIVSDFPELEAEDIKAAVEYAQANINQTFSEEENILRWWEESPTRRKLLSVNAIEKEMEAPRNAVQYFLNRKRGIAGHHLSSLINILILLGYQPVSNDHRFL